MSDTLCYKVLLVNDLASHIAKDYGVSVLDLHHVMRRHIQWHLPDGIHWNERAHRKITGIILYHICRAWHVILPPRIDRHFNVFIVHCGMTNHRKHLSTICPSLTHRFGRCDGRPDRGDKGPVKCQYFCLSRQQTECPHVLVKL